MKQVIQYGFLPTKTKKEKPVEQIYIIHKCKLPGFFRLTWRAFTFRSIAVGTLWKCPECLSVYTYSSGSGKTRYVYNCNHGCERYCDYWEHAFNRDWERAGGKV